MRLCAMMVLGVFISAAAQSANACVNSSEQEDAAFAKADVNGSHDLTVDEYFGSYKQQKPKKEWAKIFAHLDTNKDGLLTRNEYDSMAGDGVVTDGDVLKSAAPPSPTGCAGLK